MRKLLLLATMAVTALAVMASSASANPDFSPTGDANPANWEEALSYKYDYDLMSGSSQCDPASYWTNWSGEDSCAIPSPAEFDVWQLRFNNGANVVNCQLEIEGSVTGDGRVEITDADVDGSGCQTIVASGLPWEGTICGYSGGVDGSGNPANDVEYWLRQEFSITAPGGTIAGASFGKFSNVMWNGTFGAVTFDNAYIGDVPGYPGMDLRQDGTLDLTGGTENKALELTTPRWGGADYEHHPCSWPEVQA